MLEDIEQGTATILVADDEPINRSLIQRRLERAGYHVLTAQNGREAVDKTRERLPDLVLLDIMMPVMDGLEACRLIKEDATTTDIPVIFLSARDETEVKVSGLSLGANDYISKPFDAGEMRQIIDRNVERTRLQRTSEHAATEIKELNNRLMKELAQKERLASLGQASSEFVHDLSNPLTIVWGYVQLLAKKLERSENSDNGDNGASVRELNIIEENVRLCRELLTMWQSYGSVEACPRKPISVSTIVRDVLKVVGPMAAQNGIELKSEICGDPCSLLGDAVQVQRAIQNVVINAVQASVDGKTPISVACLRKEFYVDVVVEDSGSGIEPSRIEKIFDPYFTTKQGRSGTGLGLYITKKVVEDHNGSIKVNSTPGAGTIFTIRLPLTNN